MQTLDLDNRGLAYGDGLFETCRVVSGQIPWWDRHERRLRQGCERLAIDFDSIANRLPDQRDRALFENPDADWLKLIVTRQAAGRGYAPATDDANCFWSTGKLTRWPDRVSLDRYITLAGSAPTLAGVKHLNRLPDVLAARESSSAILTDAQGRLVCAGSANLFAVIDGRLMTPAIVSHGVAGIMREWVCENESVDVRPMSFGLLSLASECFVTNAIRGIVSIERLPNRAMSMATPVADRLRDQLQNSTWASL